MAPEKNPDKKWVFDYEDYRDYLSTILKERGKKRGLSARLAEHLGCEPSYISLVLSGKSHLTVERAFKISRFLGHNSKETRCFMTQVQASRAGTPELRDYYSFELKQMRRKHLEPTERIALQERPLSESDQSRFNAWPTQAIAPLLSIPRYQTEEAIAQRFGITPAEARSHLDFLISIGLATRLSNGKIRDLPGWVTTERGSAINRNAHQALRVRALGEIGHRHESGFHCSTALALSNQDIEAFKKTLRETTAQLLSNEPRTFENSADVYCLVVDFFPA